MGAMLRFKQETGKEVTSIDGESVSDVCTYLWCCTVSACAKEGVPFDYTIMDFADSIDESDIIAWSTELNSAAEADAANSDSRKKKGVKQR